MIDMVKVLSFALAEGKAAVHCHAGLGRTGLFIACYLIYTYRMSANQAIHLIRERRDGAVQMNEQIQVIKQFEKHLIPLRIVYSEAASESTFINDTLFDSNNNNNNETSTKPTNQTTQSQKQNFSFYFTLNKFLHRQKQILHGRESRKLKYIPKV
jgi:protein tyrosine phosphatase domain-containing protein 1